MMNSRSRFSVLANLLVIYGLGMFNAHGPTEIDDVNVYRNFTIVSQKLSGGRGGWSRQVMRRKSRAPRENNLLQMFQQMTIQRISQDDAITLYTTNAYTQMNGLMRAYFQGQKKFLKGKIDYETQRRVGRGRQTQSQLWLK